MPFRNMPRIGALACLEVKMIGKPYAGELHVRFDEGEQVFVARRILNGHEAGNGGDKPRIDLTNTEPVLYSTPGVCGNGFAGAPGSRLSGCFFTRLRIGFIHLSVR
jgi:hypothetical protein